MTLCCFAVAAFTYANVLWASASFTFVLGWLCCAALESLYARGARRAFAIGFFLTGSVYLGCVYGPVLDRRVGFWLLTTKSMAVVQGELNRSQNGEWETDPTLGDLPGGRAMQLLSEEGSGLSLPQWTYFQLIGHSTYALLLAWCGGLFAARLFEKNTNRGD